MTTRFTNEAAEIHRNAVVIDGVDVSVPRRERFARMQAAGLTAVAETIAIYEDFKETMREVARWESRFEEFADLIRPVTSVADIKSAKQEGRVGIILAFQNTSPFEDEPDFVRVFKRLDVRIVQLAYMFQNLAASGCLEANDAGLSDYGRHLLQALQAQGIAVDLSHCGPQTTRDAIEAAEGPVLFTHAASSELQENPRNRSDEELKMLADTGGVIGIVAFPSFLSDTDPTIEDWFQHLDHIVSVVGTDHVGIGTDFIEGQPEGFADRAYYHRPHPPGLVPPGWPWPYPEGIASVDDYPRITAGLIERGYSREDTVKILGGNFLRVFETIWD